MRSIIRRVDAITVTTSCTSPHHRNTQLYGCSRRQALQATQAKKAIDALAFHHVEPTDLRLPVPRC